jgi:hypothetical protein
MAARPDRENKKLVGAWVTVEKWKTLRHILTETQRTANDLIGEAISLLAEKYGAQQPPPTGKVAAAVIPLNKESAACIRFSHAVHRDRFKSISCVGRSQVKAAGGQYSPGPGAPSKPSKNRGWPGFDLVLGLDT